MWTVRLCHTAAGMRVHGTGRQRTRYCSGTAVMAVCVHLYHGNKNRSDGNTAVTVPVLLSVNR